MQLKVKDKIVYPGHGVAEVTEVVEKYVAGMTTVFFKLTFPYKDMTVLVAQKRVESTGIRPLSDESEIETALSELRKLPKLGSNGELVPSGWSRRHREYQLKIQTGQLLDVAKIYRDLMYVSSRKDLSFGEKSLMQVTEDLLVQEIFTARETDKESIISQIRAPFEGHANKEATKQCSSGV
ncbi:CarD family transcriptional regulator [Candidatus Dependentiae bacterium]